MIYVVLLYLLNWQTYRFKCPRQSKSRGGVAIFVLDSLTYQRRDDIEINIEGEFESIFIEIEKHNLLVGEVYRIPNTSEAISVDRYNKLTNNIMNTNLNAIIATDQNIDLLKIETNKSSSDLFDILFTNGILPTIIRPTRITHTSATLIDNIYIKHNKLENLKSGIILTDISDHLPIFACFGTTINQKQENLKITCRPMDDEQINMIIKSLENTDWNSINNDNDINSTYDKLITKLWDTVNEYAPEKNITINKNKIIRQPWMTSGLLQSINTRHNIYKISKHPQQSKTNHQTELLRKPSHRI